MGGAAIAFAICAYCRDVNLILNQFYYLLFVLVIVLLSMRVKLDSFTLLWCGQNFATNTYDTMQGVETYIEYLFESFCVHYSYNSFSSCFS